MQYSTTSNTALLNIVRSKPTLVGQYRQAVLEADRREQDLKAAQFLFQKQEQQLKLKQLELRQIQDEMKAPLAQGEKERLECLAKIAEIETNEVLYSLEQTSKLIPDAERELRFCRALIEQICSEFSPTGFDLKRLTEAEFQLLMGEEFRERQIHHWAANLLAPRVNLSPDFLLSVLETPEAERQHILRSAQEIVNAFAPPAPAPAPYVQAQPQAQEEKALNGSRAE